MIGNSINNLFVFLFSLNKIETITFKGDVSNKNSQDGVNDDKHTATGDTKNRTLRRSRRLSNVSRNDDRNPSSYHEITAAVAARNLVSKKRGRNEKTQEMPIVNPLETKRQSPSQRQEAKDQPKVEHDNFDIEAMLLEPKPKLKRKRAKSTSTRGRKKNRKNEALKRSVDPKTSKEVMSSFQSNSAILFNPKNQCSDLLVTSKDDYCLLRKVEGPFDASKFTTGIATYDKVHQEDMDQVPAYVTDIFQRLFDAEVRSCPYFYTLLYNQIHVKVEHIPHIYFFHFSLRPNRKIRDHHHRT